MFRSTTRRAILQGWTLRYYAYGSADGIVEGFISVRMRHRVGGEVFVYVVEAYNLPNCRGGGRTIAMLQRIREDAGAKRIIIARPGPRMRYLVAKYLGPVDLVPIGKGGDVIMDLESRRIGD